MQRRKFIILTGAGLATTLAGCSGSGDKKTTTPKTTSTTPTPTTEEAKAAGKAADTTSTITTTTPTTTTTTTTTATTTRQPAIKNRLFDVKLINKEESDSGLSNFDVRVTADTRMPRADSTSHGEPVLQVRINGKLITRSQRLPRKKKGTYTLTIRAPQLYGYHGKKDFQVELIDLDPAGEDVIWTEKRTLKFASGDLTSTQQQSKPSAQESAKMAATIMKYSLQDFGMSPTVKAEDDGDLECTYTSVASTSVDSAREIGAVAGAYAGAIQQNYTVGKLFAIVEDVQGRTIGKWHAKHEWAVQYNQGEITGEEYGKKCVDTLEVLT